MEALKVSQENIVFFSQNDANTNEFLGHHLSTFSLQQGRTYINRQMEYT